MLVFDPFPLSNTHMCKSAICIQKQCQHDKKILIQIFSCKHGSSCLYIIDLAIYNQGPKALNVKEI